MAKEIQHLNLTTNEQALPPVLDIFNLKGKVAIVTGGSSGLGKEMASGLALAGASVMLAARHEEALAETKKELVDAGCDVDYCCADVSKSEDVQHLMAATVERFGRIDALINDCGTTYRCPADEFPDEEFDRIIAINLRSAFLCSKYAAQQMLKQGEGGSIINIGSGAGGHAIKHSTAYCTSKGGMVMLTKSMALDWATSGIRVNIIMPGTFRTPLLDACCEKDPTYGEKWLKLHPVGRFGEPKEIAGIAIYLVSDASTYTTGTVIYVDGGGHCGRE